jgi:nucleoside-diphosphate-sugar epimerase
LSRLLIAGCGFLGESAAAFFCAAGWDIVALTATPESAARLGPRGFCIDVADISSPASLEEVRARHGDFDVVLHCASSGRGGADAYRRVYVDGCAAIRRVFLQARLIFTSSTSVYAQTDGEWVTEDSPTEPLRDTGRLLLDAEKIAVDSGGVVLRLAGLYGPGRSVLLRRFQDGTAILENGGGRWINQIHRDDAARAILRVAEAGIPGTIYNVADDRPAMQREVYGWIADFLGRPLPPDGPGDPNRKRGWTSKRVSNARLRALGWSPEFPDYCAALPALAAA